MLDGKSNGTCGEDAPHNSHKGDADDIRSEKLELLANALALRGDERCAEDVDRVEHPYRADRVRRLLDSIDTLVELDAL